MSPAVSPAHRSYGAESKKAALCINENQKSGALADFIRFSMNQAVNGFARKVPLRTAKLTDTLPVQTVTTQVWCNDKLTLPLLINHNFNSRRAFFSVLSLRLISVILGKNRRTD